LAAVTATRIVKPTSPLESRYEALVAPLTFTHDEPALSQWRHWYPYEVGEPLHVPVEADKDWLSAALPEMTGNPVFAGAETGAGAGAGAGATTAVGLEVADADPYLFDAVTTTCKV
jgi:hypothetical protein